MPLRQLGETKLNICTFPTKPPFNPLRLASNYRDYFGDPHALLTEMTDVILNSGCYVPRIYQTPDTFLTDAGVEPNGFLDYALAIPGGSFILGFLTGFTSGPSANLTDPPVTSGFRVQITDVRADHKFFAKPVPEAYLLNDIPSSNPQGVLDPTSLAVQNQTVRLLPAPYPVVPPGIFKMEFWNFLEVAGVPVTNFLVRLAVLVAIPDPDMKENK